MADLKISQLPAVNTGTLNGSEPFALVQGGVTVKMTLQEWITVIQGSISASATITTGTGNPSGGNDGDFYIQRDASASAPPYIFWLKISGTWTPMPNTVVSEVDPITAGAVAGRGRLWVQTTAAGDGTILSFWVADNAGNWDETPLSGSSYTVPQDTWINWDAQRQAGTLPIGRDIIVSDIAAGLRLKTNQTGDGFELQGSGEFLVIDKQLSANADYSGVIGYALYNGTDANAGIWTVAKESIMIDGNVVIWNNLHWLVIDAGAFDGTDPFTNVTAYKVLDGLISADIDSSGVVGGIDDLVANLGSSTTTVQTIYTIEVINNSTQFIPLSAPDFAAQTIGDDIVGDDAAGTATIIGKNPVSLEIQVEVTSGTFEVGVETTFTNQSDMTSYNINGSVYPIADGLSWNDGTNSGILGSANSQQTSDGNYFTYGATPMDHTIGDIWIVTINPPVDQLTLGYLVEVDTINYDFPNDDFLIRIDKRNNVINNASFASFQFGDDTQRNITVDNDGVLNNLNSMGTLENAKVSNGNYTIVLQSGTTNSEGEYTNSGTFIIPSNQSFVGRKLTQTGSTFTATVDITGGGDIDLLGTTTNKYAGIFLQTSSNPTETVTKYNNGNTLFGYAVLGFPDSLAITIQKTDIGSAAVGDIVTLDNNNVTLIARLDNLGDYLALTTGVNGINEEASRKIYGVSADGSMVIELGTIGFADLNSAPVATDVYISLTTNDFPANYYIVGIGVDITVAFDSVDPILGDLTPDGWVIGGTGLQSSGVSKTMVYGNFISIENIVDTKSAHISFGGGVNPQNYTVGSVTIYAIIKPFPF